jgi:hypothetical protein
VTVFELRAAGKTEKNERKKKGKRKEKYLIPKTDAGARSRTQVDTTNH